MHFHAPESMIVSRHEMINEIANPVAVATCSRLWAASENLLKTRTNYHFSGNRLYRQHFNFLLPSWRWASATRYVYAVREPSKPGGELVCNLWSGREWPKPNAHSIASIEMCIENKAQRSIHQQWQAERAIIKKDIVRLKCTLGIVHMNGEKCERTIGQAKSARRSETFKTNCSNRVHKGMRSSLFSQFACVCVWKIRWESIRKSLLIAKSTNGLLFGRN